MNFLNKIRSLPEKKRKVILWVTVIVIALILLVVWIKFSKQRIESFNMEEFKEGLGLPSLEGPELPSFEESMGNLMNTNEENQ
jgi:hypothetical protein